MSAVSEFVPIRRIRNGRPFTEELLVELDGDLMTIRSEWGYRRQDFRRVAEYRVVPDPEAKGGQGFILFRDAEAVEKDPDHTERYGVLIAGTESRCECKGKASTEQHGRTCRHVAALAHLLTIGAL